MDSNVAAEVSSFAAGQQLISPPKYVPLTTQIQLSSNLLQTHLVCFPRSDGSIPDDYKLDTHVYDLFLIQFGVAELTEKLRVDCAPNNSSLWHLKRFAGLFFGTALELTTEAPAGFSEVMTINWSFCLTSGLRTRALRCM